MNFKQPRGFTLIELVVVIAILAILAAFALPRFADMADEAHRSSVEGSGGAMAAAVALVRSQWLARGEGGAVQNLPGYGDETIDTSIEGWPTGVNGNTNPDGMSSTECRDLWIKLLQTSAPSVSTGGGSDYSASVNGGDCRYTYQRDSFGNYVQYDPNQGEVFTKIN
ncbi:prepilin-type N-terminal cleavage/methylation domain-containing protein [Alkalimarinus coralli]|uniref:prepilin-type N-terminal cleavage/methylation domain-containing protein n=1 Tax=Alkalimarinus coralli TaxID=2935863 RepID=UPI0023DF7DB1|nr:prepilin-type N-terminal cleavage/methylation domain-containing protein [Alkalimarinus coralli]